MKTKDLPVKRFASRAAWETWLAKHHERSPVAEGAFAELDSQNRYAILYRLQAAKQADTRQRRLSTFVRMLERGETLHPRKSTEVHVEPFRGRFG